MNVNSQVIPGIYNFCDSWCERCLFTQRCHSYQVQTENGLIQSADPNVTLVEQLKEALNLTKQYLNKVRPKAPADGLSDTQQQLLEQQALPASSVPHAVMLLAHTYLRQSSDWLRVEKRFLEDAGYRQLHEVELGIRTEADAMIQLNTLKDAWDIITWYRTLIPVKTASALRFFSEPTASPRVADYYVGKAKLVLVSVDRSILAWQTVMTYYPEKTDELLDMLVVLNHIGRDLEKLFLGARAFRRPGFD